MSVLDLLIAQEYLNAASVNAVELQAVIDAAEATIAERVGPLAATAVTRQVRGGGTALVLPVVPAISLTSVTPSGGTALTLTDLSLDAQTGIVTHVTASYLFWQHRYTVVYQAGYATVPADLMLAIKELVRHMWTTQRGSGTSRPGAPPPESLPGAAYALPMRVEQLLAPHQRFGFA